ncbi:MAG: long-chain fatty acid--CoA ligase [Puniceicoccaceae bacterium]
MHEVIVSEKQPWTADTVAHLFQRMAVQYRGLTALVSHRNANDQRSRLTYDALIERSTEVAEGLVELGLNPGDRVMVLADNRLEWQVSSIAITFAGGVDVPRGNDATHDEINYIVSHSASRFLFVETARHLERVLRNLDDHDSLDGIVVMDEDGLTEELRQDPQITSLDELARAGRKRMDAGRAQCPQRIEAIRPEDPYTIIYTSGTTGRPKGVVLTHANLMSQVCNVPITIRKQWEVLTILPIWHSYERTFELIVLARGIQMTYSSVRTIGPDMRELRPQIMVSAPRLWENVYSRIQHSIRSGSVVKRTMFKSAYACAYAFFTALDVLRDRQLELRYIAPPERVLRKGIAALVALVAFLPYRLMDRIVFSKLRAVIGGRFEFTVSGGGALQPHIDRFFNYIGIRVLEGYGMTESGPVLSVRLPEKLVIGTVGPMWPHTELRIVDPETKELLYPNPKLPHEGKGLKGEIHIRGPQVMQGYFRSPEETAKVIRKGWLNTGDLGVYTFNNCLKILGRTKDTVVLLSGENIEPVPIENRISQSELIANCMVVGQDQKYLGLLVIPSVEGFQMIDSSLDSIEKITKSKEAKAMVDAYIHDVVSAKAGFKSYERIHSWRWIDKPFEVGEEITTTFKLKRHVVARRYADVIASMFPNEARK